MDDQVKELNTINLQLNSELRDARKKVSELELKLEGGNEKVISKLNNEISSLRDELESKDDEIKDLKSDIENETDSREEAEKEKEEAEEDLSKLQDEFDSIPNELLPGNIESESKLELIAEHYDLFTWLELKNILLKARIEKYENVALTTTDGPTKRGAMNKIKELRIELSNFPL